MSKLDDDEQYEWIRRWSTKQRRMQAEILQVRTAHRDGAISWIRTQVIIARSRRKDRRMPRVEQERMWTPGRNQEGPCGSGRSASSVGRGKTERGQQEER